MQTSQFLLGDGLPSSRLRGRAAGAPPAFDGLFKSLVEVHGSKSARGRNKNHKGHEEWNEKNFVFFVSLR
ncbi:MAG TPA: hypothetical protein VG433_02910, partial [Pirellulales bacterium]|nr:hypothetical protein [Pirellulales bacterium]